MKALKNNNKIIILIFTGIEQNVSLLIFFGNTLGTHIDY